jgi:uncharacterized protein (TIGR03118 family)
MKSEGPPLAVVETDLVVDQDVNGVPTLVDSNGITHIAKFFDPNLANPWGLASSGGSPFWVSDNAAHKSTLYNSAGSPQSLVVTIPAPGDPLTAAGSPTGVVFNIAGSGAFKISGVDRNGHPATAGAIFIFATEDGTILGWNPGVNPPGFDPAKAGTYAIIAVDKSQVPDAENGAVYKGLAIAIDPNTKKAFLYATNFRAGTVEVYGDDFKPATGLPADAFTDPKLPSGYAPFNIAPVGGKLFVTYAVQDDTRHDDVAGESHGIVDTFDLNGEGEQRFAQHGQLNSPWGIAVAPASFGEFAGAILIGNFGNGHINAFDADTGQFLNKVRDPDGQAIVIDGLWALRVGNGGNGGDVNTVYFTAGPNGESDGIFGSLTATSK